MRKRTVKTLLVTLGVIAIQRAVETGVMVWAWRSRNARALSLVKRYNKLTRPVRLRSAGRSGLHAAVHHVGRRSGTPYTDQVQTIADASGAYELEDVPPGSYALAVTGEDVGWSPRTRTLVEVPGAGEIVHDIVLGEPSLEGTVLDRASRTPIASLAAASFSVVRSASATMFVSSGFLVSTALMPICSQFETSFAIRVRARK